MHLRTLPSHSARAAPSGGPGPGRGRIAPSRGVKLVRSGMVRPVTAQVPALTVSVVVPVYRSIDTLPILVARVHAALQGVLHEIVMVDDGSPRATWEMVEQLATGDASVVGLRLGRNAGQHNALLAGLRASRYEITVTIDDDLQNPPEEIPCLLDALSEDVDVVYGAPQEVAQRRWRRRSSSWMRTFMASSLGVDNAARLSSFRAFRTGLRDGFDGDLGPGVSIDALLSWSTSRFAWVYVGHDERAQGRSNYTFRKLLRFALDTATGYSAVPLQIAMSLGLLTALSGFVLFAWVVGRLIVQGTDVPGFPFLASMVAIFSGVQLITIGIIGEYLARMHFRVMRKPTYVIAQRTARRTMEEDEA
jgi:glycosyltransferase involved in cell wall biosynthesis